MRNLFVKETSKADHGFQCLKLSISVNGVQESMNQHESGPESIQHPQAVCAGALHAIHGLEAKYLKMLLRKL